MNALEDAGNKKKDYEITSPLKKLGICFACRRNPKKELEDLEKEVNKTKTGVVEESYESEGVILDKIYAFLGLNLLRAEDLLGEDYGRLSEEKRKTKLLRAKNLFDTLKRLEKQYSAEKVSQALKTLFSYPLFSILLSGSYISEDKKASLIPAGFTEKVLEIIIIAQERSKQLGGEFTLLCQRAVLENTLITRTTNLEKIRDYAIKLQKIKSDKVVDALLSTSKKHVEVFIDEAKTNLFIAAVDFITENNELSEEALTSFILNEDVGLWRLITENRVSDFLKNPHGYLLIHLPKTNSKPEIFSETKEEAASLCCEFAGKEDVEEALKHFYVWKTKVLEEKEVNTLLLTSENCMNEFTEIMLKIPEAVDYLKGFRITLLEDSQANHKLGVYFNLFKLIQENAGLYYSRREAGSLAEKLMKYAGYLQNEFIALIRTQEGFIPLTEAAGKELSESFKVLEFMLKPPYSLRGTTYYRQKPTNQPTREVNGFYTVEWSYEPSYWTNEVKKILGEACSEIQKKGLTVVLAASEGICDGSFKQTDKLYLTAYIRGEEKDLPAEQIECMLKTKAALHGICVSKFGLEIKYLGKTAELFYHTIASDNGKVFLTWPSKQELLKRKKTGDKSEDIVVWFNGKTIYRIDYVGSRISSTISCLKNVLDLTLDDLEKREHKHTALIEVEAILIENSSLFREILLEAYKENQGLRDVKTIYVKAVSSLAGLDPQIISDLVEEGESMDCGISPTHRDSPWNKYLEMLGGNINT